MLKSNGVLLWDDSVSDSTRAAGSNKTAWCEELFREIDASFCALPLCTRENGEESIIGETKHVAQQELA